MGEIFRVVHHPCDKCDRVGVLVCSPRRCPNCGFDKFMKNFGMFVCSNCHALISPQSEPCDKCKGKGYVPEEIYEKA